MLQLQYRRTSEPELGWNWRQNSNWYQWITTSASVCFQNSLSHKTFKKNTRDLQFLLFSAGFNKFKRFLKSSPQETGLMLISFSLAQSTDNFLLHSVLEYRNWEKISRENITMTSDLDVGLFICTKIHIVSACHFQLALLIIFQCTSLDKRYNPAKSV